jgi:hypothetical protein
MVEVILSGSRFPRGSQFQAVETEFSTFGLSAPTEDPGRHALSENDDHIFMVLEGEGLVHTPLRSTQ